MSSSSSQPLAGRRIWIAGIGGAGMSAYALLAQAWGAEVAGWDRVETPYLAHLSGIAVEIAPEPSGPPAGWEVVRLHRIRRTRRRAPARGSARRARLAPAVDRRRRRARQDDDERDDRVLPRPARARPRVPHRRRDAAARRQRARGGGLARRRGRRVRPLRRRAASGDRGPAERRPRPSHDLLLACRGRGDVRGVAHARSARRARGGARTGRDRARAFPACTTGATRPPRSRHSSSPVSKGPTASSGSSGASTAGCSAAPKACSTATRTIPRRSPPT